MDPLQVVRLKEEHKKGLQLCEEKIQQWEKFKTDYEKLKQHLETLPDAVSYDITVPFGPNAFTMGQLVHTNELMVLLGDNWFAEVSAKQAMGIADRRIAQCSGMLNDLAKEKQQFDNWLTYIDEVSNENLVEIVEKYDEEEERKWREQHSKNVRSYHQKLAEEKKHSIIPEDTVASNSDDDYIARLESLELTEKSEQKDPSDTEEGEQELSLKKNLSESEGSVPECADEMSPPLMEKTNKPQLKLNINCINEQSMAQETESGDEDSSKSDDVNSNLENCNADSSSKHVRWQDLSKHNVKKITFRHTKVKHHTHPNHQLKKQSSSESEEPLIQSPSDIYKHFGGLFQATSPKSILKVKNSPTTPDGTQSFFPVDEFVPKKDCPNMKSENIVNAFSGKVYEHSSPTHITEKKTSPRPSSHFKNTRKNRRR